MKSFILTLSLIALLSACVPTGRYSMRHDKAPLRKPTNIEMQNPTPKVEPIYAWSLKPYTVRGKRYHPLKSATGYATLGVASWYGRKFHGHTTANGEIYDMFAMTAAHKTLPIPSYVKVTNTANNRSIIVRVNDRGPFHDDRVIDLSYSAAYAIDMLAQGTAQVRLEALNPADFLVKQHNKQLNVQLDSQPAKQTTKANIEITQAAKPPMQQEIEPAVKATVKPLLKQKVELKPRLFVQVVASQDGKKIQIIAEQLSTQYQQDNQVTVNQGLHILRLGPLQSKPQAQSLIEALKNNGYPGAYMLYSTPTLPHN